MWRIVTELLPWPCPLTVLENWLESRAESNLTTVGSATHLDQLVYGYFFNNANDCGVIICALSLASMAGKVLVADCANGMVTHAAMREPIYSSARHAHPH